MLTEANGAKACVNGSQGHCCQVHIVIHPMVEFSVEVVGRAG